jgi:hypothetical protein
VTIPCPRKRGSSTIPPCKRGCPEVYPQTSKKSVSELFDHTLYNWLNVPTYSVGYTYWTTHVQSEMWSFLRILW